MTPAELLGDHARRPRHLGKLLNASAVGDVGSIVAGDAMRFYLKIEGGPGQERITGARFQVFNCQGQTGPASAVAELVTGMPLAEAEELDLPDLLAHLGGLSHLELPPRIWGIEGLRAACAVWRGTDAPADIELELPLLCRCLGIPEETVRQAITVRGLTGVEQAVDATGAGSVCQSCRVDLALLLERSAGGGARPAAGARAAGAPSRIQLMQRIRGCAEEKVLPGLRAGGGDLELWDLLGTTLLVRAHGRLSADPEARRLACASLEAALRSAVDPLLQVEASAG